MALDETLRAPGDRRYVIVGAGAIGGTVGAVLARAGIPAVLVARGRHAETLAAEGLTLQNAGRYLPHAGQRGIPTPSSCA